MHRTTAALMLLLACAACGKSGDQAASAPAAPAAAPPVTTPATDAPAQPTDLAGVPGFAQRGVDSANAAQQRQLDSVNALGNSTP